MDKLSSIVVELMPYYFRNDLNGMLVHLQKPEVLTKMSECMMELYNDKDNERKEHINMMKDMSNSLKDISKELKEIKEALLYSPGGKGYEETKEEFNKKRKISE